MGTILTESSTFDAQITVPNPGEPVRAGGGVGNSVDIPGFNGDPNGRITYTSVVAFVRVEQLGGISMTLGVTISGNDVIVQLGTDAGGNITSTASAVVTQVNAVASAFCSAITQGTGAGTPGISGFVELSYGSVGSVRPMEQSLTNRTRYLFDNLSTKTNVVLSGQPLHPYITIPQAGNNLFFVTGVPDYYNRTGIGPTYTPVFVANIPAFDLDTTFLDVGTAYAPSTWYYVYSNVDGTIHTSTVIPDRNTLAYRGDTTATYKYMFSFFTSSATPGIAMPFTKAGRSYNLVKPQLLVNGATLGTTATKYELQDAVIGGAPTTATQIYVRYVFSNSGGSSENVVFGGTSTPTTGVLIPAGQSEVISSWQAVSNLRSGFPNDFGVWVAASVASVVTMYLWVDGWME